MQFYALGTLRRIFTLRHGARHNGKGFQDSFVGKVVYQRFALDLNHRTNFDTVQNRFGFLIFQKATHPDRRRIVGHIKIDDPGIPLCQLFMFNIEHFTFNDNRSHIQGQFLHGYRFAFEGFSVYGLTGLGSSRLRLLLRNISLGQIAHHRRTHPLHSRIQVRTFQLFAHMNLNGNIAIKALAQPAADSRNAFLQLVFSVCFQTDMQAAIFPLPNRTGQGAAGHGIFSNKQRHQIFRWNVLQLRSRMKGQKR